LKEKNRKINILSFNGIECLTDTVFYILYKHFRHDEIFSELSSVTLDTCRYVTDLGIELIDQTTGKRDRIRENTSRGCDNIKYYFHAQNVGNEEEKGPIDLCRTKRFVRSSSDRIEFSSYKVFILNETKLNLSKFIQKKEVEFDRKIVDYVKFNHKNETIFNLIELDAVGLCFFFFSF
jgi:hypothetical protein